MMLIQRCHRTALIRIKYAILALGSIEISNKNMRINIVDSEFRTICV